MSAEIRWKFLQVCCFIFGIGGGIISTILTIVLVIYRLDRAINHEASFWLIVPIVFSYLLVLSSCVFLVWHGAEYCEDRATNAWRFTKTID